MRWVANAPTSRFTSDGNADRCGSLQSFSPILQGGLLIAVLRKRMGCNKHKRRNYGGFTAVAVF